MAIVPLHGQQRDGSNAFTYSRFLVPWLCGFRGWAIWADGADMMLRADIAEAYALRLADHRAAVFVAKHEYLTRHPRKYVGTPMEAPNADYPRKNWSSFIIWDCGHEMNRFLTPEYVASNPGAHLHRFAWLPDELIGALPIEWNWLADEYGENANAKLIHWTAGMPGFAHYADAPMADGWHEMARTLHSER